jgi:FkbM family methyltransferase
LEQSQEGYVLLPTAQKSPDGTPRFTLSLPNSYASDPGLALLVKLESQHAGFEFTTRAFFDRHLMPGDIFLDVGAHFGLYAMSAATLLPGNVKVFAFEPHPLNALSALRQFGQNGLQNEIELICSAVGREPSFGKLWPFSTMGNFISTERPEAAWADNPPLTVPILSLDMFVEQRPDLASGRIMMKVDVEGYEPEVMAGADGLLSSGRVGAIVFEKSDAYVEPLRRQAFDQMIERLRAHGYRIRWFPHLHMPCALVPWVEGNETGNLVAIAPGLKVDAVYDGPHVDYVGLPPPLMAKFSSADQRKLTERLIESRASDGWRWANPKNMEVGSEERAAIAAQYFGPADRILDLGSGLLRTSMHLRSRNVYTPVDLVRYSKFTILADLNDGGFPEGEWDCALALELFEHIHDVPKLLVQIRSAAARLVCTYCCLEDVGDLTERRERGYFNDFGRAELQASFTAAGWQVIIADADERQSIFVCE